MIKLDNITKIYKKSNKGIRQVNLEINAGEIIALLGENGSGKTTLIKSIYNGTIFDSGNITYNGEDIFKNNNLRKIEFFLDTNNIPLNIKVDDFINYSCLIKEIKKEEINEIKDQIYNVLDLNQYKNSLIKNLSAGQKKRVTLAKVLCTKPEIIIFDEPTANVDITTKQEILNLIQNLSITNQIGILITSHIIDELQEIANKVIVIKEGIIVYNDKFDNKTQKLIDIYNKYYQSNRNFKSIVDIYDKK